MSRQQFLDRPDRGYCRPERSEGSPCWSTAIISLKKVIDEHHSHLNQNSNCK
ncbi:hypothetical protein Lmac_2504 [Legionella maceachernii]|uniref:Uncharacterized protein n=1 Tax=Legionella maceachernii TaxID=466 RepID=A0A0W0VWM1_9GAMM|nr:hypothetical protein Lmac_2504 [Legionella maceachernii]SJZ67338.1 hypothetical protein SAMN02745128_00729 [Legionella maceachernii]SUP02042.1 Uncharacterised protein [Legionella maceachernii]